MGRIQLAETLMPFFEEGDYDSFDEGEGGGDEDEND
jgi:hypothetical protein